MTMKLEMQIDIASQRFQRWNVKKFKITYFLIQSSFMWVQKGYNGEGEGKGYVPSSENWGDVPPLKN